VRRFVGAVVRGAIALNVLAAVGGTAMYAHAQDSSVPPTADGSAGSGTASLVIVPSGCVSPRPPVLVFDGTLVDRDFRTGRFRINQVRDGDPAPFAADGVIDVRYGNDAQYLELDEEYLVGAGVDPDLGVLVSQIRAPAPPFGGDDVIGAAESDVPCPVLEDPIRTLRPDGSSVESGVLAPFFDERKQLAGAFLIPLGVACAVLAALACLRLLLGAIARGVGSLARQRR
jgi:hypothetical protein